MNNKVNIPLVAPNDVPEDYRHRWIWTKFALVTPVVVVTTMDSGGKENAAPKNCIMPCSNDPHMLAFTCNMAHDTMKNIIDTGEFVVNIPGQDIFKQVMKMGAPLPRGISEIEFAELTSLPSESVKPPRIAECRAHAECVLEWYKETGKGVIVVGNVVAASANEDLYQSQLEDRLSFLRPIVCWPDGFASVTEAWGKR